MRTALVALSALYLCQGADAQPSEFEPPAYAVGLLGGQQGWATNTFPNFWTGQLVCAYGPSSLANPYHIADHPGGSLQFIAGRSEDGPLLAGSHHAIDFGGGGVWTIEWDCLCKYDGTVLPAADNLGGFRTGIPDGAGNYDYWQANPRWSTHASTPDRYDLTYWQFPATPGSGYPYPPGPEWTNIPVNHWIHQSTTWSFASNRILSVSIRDITAGGSTTTLDLSDQDWYLAGGANNTLALPTGITMYSGGGVGGSYGGNVVAWDNIRVAPACYANCDASTSSPVLNVNDFVCFQSRFAAGDSYANCDQSTAPPVLTINDFVCFQSAFAAGCSAP